VTDVDPIPEGAVGEPGPRPASPLRGRLGASGLANAVVFVLSIAFAFAFWEAASRSGVIREQDLPSMTDSVGELWRLMQTWDFWSAFLHTARGWAIGLGLATLLAVPIGVVLGLSDFAGRAFRVPVEFLRPIPSAALIPLLFLTLGPTLRSEIFLATFGAFWPILVQTMYGVRDVDPVTVDTARSFGVPHRERLWRITLPSAVPYIAAGMRLASAVSLILACTAELFMGTPGLGQLLNYAQSYGLTTQLYALALATGVLGLATHLLFTALERRALRWHPSQRLEAPA
jgi:ABC-type nitrate/sulfonate/bicarbonate transport system permease component